MQKRYCGKGIGCDNTDMIKGHVVASLLFYPEGEEKKRDREGQVASEGLTQRFVEKTN